VTVRERVQDQGFRRAPSHYFAALHCMSCTSGVSVTVYLLDVPSGWGLVGCGFCFRRHAVFRRSFSAVRRSAVFCSQWCVVDVSDGPLSYAVIGDVGGHLSFFTDVLDRVGWDPASACLDPSVVVVQVGDLVHKGPDSQGCVRLADRLMRANPHSYVQLVGNHEAHYLGGPDVSGRVGVVPVDPATVDMLRSWWDSGRVRVAYAVPDTAQFGPVLVTHAGLTAGFWRELGSPATVEQAADVLNGPARISGEVFRPGGLMTGLVDPAAGPLCALTGQELADGWVQAASMPFSQVHGHAGVWSWPGCGFHDDVPARVRAVSSVDPVRRFCWVDVAARVLFSVDPVLGLSVPPGYSPQPLWLSCPPAGTVLS